MRRRGGFVPNSSSCSYIVRWDDELLGEAWKALRLHDPRAPSPFPTVRDVALCFAQSQVEKTTVRDPAWREKLAEDVHRIAALGPDALEADFRTINTQARVWQAAECVVVVDTDQNEYEAWELAQRRINSMGGVKTEWAEYVPDEYAEVWRG